ncbi:MAG: propionyl-coenzyme A carboxylase alpha polypeptide [Mesorhizobium sp.]|nr:MAG: propionyl-coenzyme A carboxylase alpha polypeptide [Mesorhizobium sp.]TJU97448.1 MAG: propionyl-coenzyme A carboxylase alpha polypeptide [Mesorhizobium sp.]TJV16637.1 MAG: propionyl-coenzyme A carboxylase alpha polypeptide [Mesorhizobium sp.]
MPAISPSRGEIIHFIVLANGQRRKAGTAPKLPISPREGEMPGRAEGGASHHASSG